VIVLLASALLAAACAPRGATEAPGLDLQARLPPVAAQYRTRIERGGAEQIVEWRFWRAPDRLVSENLTARTTEEWQREGATLFLKRAFHDDRRGIEYQMDDLRIAGEPPQWTRQALIVDPQLLGALTVRRGLLAGDAQHRRYVGELEGSHWDVTMHIEQMLPVRIERRRDGLIERTELVALHALSAAPWQPTPTDAYPFIDYADLGDMESDPFVQKVHRLLGHGHAH
jgi:hypothetical protein